MRFWLCILLFVSSLGCGETHSNEVDSALPDTAADTTAPDAHETDGGDTGPMRPACPAAGCISTFSSPLGLMPRVQLENLSEVAFGRRVSFEAVVSDRGGPFSSGGAVSAAVLESMLSATGSLVDSACGDGCDLAEVTRIVTVLFRRPLTEEEQTAMAASVASGSTGGSAVLYAALLSPDFLLNVDVADLGEGTHAIAADAISARISLALTDRYTSSVALVDVSARRAYARELLTMGASATSIARFHREWLGIQEVDADLRRETELFVEHVYDEEGTLNDLLGSRYTFANPAVAARYGETSSGDDFARLPLGDQYASLLTHGSFLTRWRSPIIRGVVLRSRFLCDEVPPPPAGIEVDPLPEPDPGATRRERTEAATADPVCQSCHTSIDDLGFSLESFDEEGSFRVMDGASDVDDSFVVRCGGSESVTGAGAPELASWLGESEKVRACYARQWMRFITGADSTVCSAQQTFQDGGDLRRLLIDLVSSDAFAEVRGPRLASFAFPVVSAGPLADGLDAVIARTGLSVENDAARATLEQHRDAARAIRERLVVAP